MAGFHRIHSAHDYGFVNERTNVEVREVNR